MGGTISRRQCVIDQEVGFDVAVVWGRLGIVWKIRITLMPINPPVIAIVTPIFSALSTVSHSRLLDAVGVVTRSILID